ncbi:response regulator [Pseudoalteromonas rubra]|uniref:Response regulatory domain-containing protein n=1 Tax=Pseudoalteromonas rubra TaxID=43658 RepID=A0A0F4QRA5_9GAMM|nr:response regulator [Pseudoalteromonas rubra]KJZ10226.1 hypothetical protein TW77_08370 [Pseudoalteromonas rubra]
MKTLVVDSSAFIRKSVVQVLSQMGYQDSVQVDTCSAALEELNKGGFDLVIADWHMPDMSGLEFVKTIWAGPHNNVSFLMMTVIASRTEISEALRAGVNNYIVKPFTAGGLREAIESVIVHKIPGNTFNS